MAEPTKPTDLPVWATTLANDVTTGQPNRAEPSSGKKVTGFTFNEKPPRQDFNWLFYILGTWIQWLDSILNQSLLTTSSPTFAALTLSDLNKTAGQLTIRTITSGLLSIQSAGAILFNAVGAINFAKGFSVIDDESAVMASISDTGDITGRAVITGTDFSVRGSTTNVTGAELETLSDGSNADALHTHGTVSPFLIIPRCSNVAQGSGKYKHSNGTSGITAHNPIVEATGDSVYSPDSLSFIKSAQLSTVSYEATVSGNAGTLYIMAVTQDGTVIDSDDFSFSSGAIAGSLDVSSVANGTPVRVYVYLSNPSDVNGYGIEVDDLLLTVVV